MEQVIVGWLTAVTFVLVVAFWQLLVRPERLLGLWADPDADDGWFDDHPGALRGLRCALGTVLFLSGFLTGLAVTFLLGT